jgi:hypothetical protein
MFKETVHPTRFTGLGYVNHAKGLWRFVDLDHPNPYYCPIGPFYRTKADLLGDMTNFALSRGFDGAPHFGSQPPHYIDTETQDGAQTLRLPFQIRVF